MRNYFELLSCEQATLIIAATVIAIMLIGLSINYFFTHREYKIIRTKATVLAKSTKPLLSPSLFTLNKQIMDALPKDILVYTITFKTPNGKERDFEVSESMYEAIMEGQTDTLIYEGEELLQFGNWTLAPLHACAAYKGIRKEFYT